jgi:nucleoside-diphosphate-sugar epimerase
MANVLVTGANGYLGGWLTRNLLLQGHSICAVGSRDDWVEQAKGRQFDTVIHLGWYSSAGNDNPELQQYCADKTKLLIDSIASEPWPCKFIFASTCSVYGVSYSQPAYCFKESDPINPDCAYTNAKAEIETYLRQSNISSLIFRFGSLMGLGHSRTRLDLVVNAFASDAYATGIIEIWDPDCYKPLLHVRDAAEVICQGVAQDEWVGIVNAASCCLKAKHIAELVARITGARIEVVEGKHGAKNCCADSRRLRLAMPAFKFRPLRNAIAEFINFSLDQGDRNQPWVLQ